jgi:hypothetical protein
MKIIRLTFLYFAGSNRLDCWMRAYDRSVDRLEAFIWAGLRKSCKAIMSDYRDYIQKLPDEERNSVGPIFLFEAGAGQHAAEFKVGVNGTVWEHVLIYDKDNTRVKTIKYSNGGYRS